jgi:hypothetical protein
MQLGKLSKLRGLDLGLGIVTITTRHVELFLSFDSILSSFNGIGEFGCA